MGFSDLFTIAPGASLDRQLSQYAAAYIRIDNLSNQWYFIPGSIQRYCPPLTLGWYTRIVPSANRVQINAVAAPSGGVQSQPTGANVSIWTYDDDPQWASQFYGPSGGIPISPSGIQIPRSTITLAITTDPTPDTQIQTTLLAAPGVGLRYRAFGASIRKIHTTPAALMSAVYGVFSSTAAFSGFLYLGCGANVPTDHEFLGDVGYPMTDNLPVVINHRADIGSLNIGVQITYSIEGA